MKKALLILPFLTASAFLVSFTIFKTTQPAAEKRPQGVIATCYGYKDCKACKNCKYCKHCAKDGGTCGVCK